MSTFLSIIQRIFTCWKLRKNEVNVSNICKIQFLKNYVIWDVTTCDLLRTDVLEERVASMVRVKRIGEVETKLAVTSNWSTLRMYLWRRTLIFWFMVYRMFYILKWYQQLIRRTWEQNMLPKRWNTRNHSPQDQNLQGISLFAKVLFCCINRTSVTITFVLFYSGHDRKHRNILAGAPLISYQYKIATAVQMVCKNCGWIFG
jgi:hypothetical protein